MGRLLVPGVIASVFVAMLSLSSAATNLNSSKSNIYRVIYDTTVVSPAQASALLAELDKLGPADEAKLKQWLSANFKKHGIEGDRIKKIIVRPASAGRKSTSIIFLKDPADEAQAIAVDDEGAPGKPMKPTTK